MKKTKSLYYALIATFTLLYLLIAFVSTLHAISFFQLANIGALAILLGIAYEVGQSTILFSILMTENKNRLLSWTMMLLLTALQITANVYASFKFMDTAGNNDWTFWQRSILFAVQADSPEMYKIIISWISGALLPIVALGMTALVADNIRLARGEGEKESQITETQEIEKAEIPEAENEMEKMESVSYSHKEEPQIDEDSIRMEEIINNEVEKRLKEKLEREFPNNLPIIEKQHGDLHFIDDIEKNLKLNEVEEPIVVEEEPIIEDLGGIFEEPARKEAEEVIQEEPKAVIVEEFFRDPKKEIPVSILGENAKPKKSRISKKDMELKLDVKEVKVSDTKKANPEKKSKKIISEPINKIPGWHLMKEYVDKDSNVFSKGAFVRTDKSKKPTKPKKESGRNLVRG